MHNVRASPTCQPEPQHLPKFLRPLDFLHKQNIPNDFKACPHMKTGLFFRFLSLVPTLLRKSVKFVDQDESLSKFEPILF